MIIIGLEGCIDCDKYAAIHLDYKYIELSKKKKTKSTPEIIAIKKALTKLKFDNKFPVLLNDSKTILVPRKQLMQELKMKMSKRSSGCSRCGK